MLRKSIKPFIIEKYNRQLEATLVITHASETWGKEENNQKGLEFYTVHDFISELILQFQVGNSGTERSRSEKELH